MFHPSAVRLYLVTRLGLGLRSPISAPEMVRRLEAVQLDPVNLLARNHDLVFFNRLESYCPGRADYYQGPDRLFEYIAGNRALLPIEDLPLFIPRMREREKRHRENLARLAGPIRHVLREIEKKGPLTSRRIAWNEKINGYWDSAAEARTKETSFALQILWETGRVAVAGRAGAEILYDLPERLWPAELLRRGREISPAEAARKLRHKYYRALAVFDPGHAIFGWQGMSAAERRRALAEDERSGAIEPLVIDGVKRPYWALAGTADALSDLPAAAESGEVRFLSPLDNLLWRRERLEDLFGFGYRWEIYIPAVKRKGGPYTLPILRGSELIGRLDARVDRRGSNLIVDRLSFEPGVRSSRALALALDEELDRLRGFCGVEGIIKGR